MGCATRHCYARPCCRIPVSARRPRRAATNSKRFGARRVVALEMMVRLGHAHRHASVYACECAAVMQICVAWATGRRLRANTEHAVLNCVATLEKSIRGRHVSRRWAPKRAFVILSDHLQSNVEAFALSGVRLIMRRWNASIVRSIACVHLNGCSDQSSVATATSGDGAGTWILLRRVGAGRAPLVSEPRRGFANMTTSGAGRIQTSIKGEAVRCEGAWADQRKMAAT